jgi:hypothetical protein
MILNQEPKVELKEFEVTICDAKMVIKTFDEIEAATLAVEQLRKIKEGFDIGLIIQVKDISKTKNNCVYILAEIALANAGLYKEARVINELFQKQGKKK